MSAASTKERTEAILSLFDAGVNLRDIGERFGVSGVRVGQIAIKAGRKPRQKQTEEYRERLAKRLVEMHRVSAAEAANALGISVEAVRYLAKNEGVNLLRRNSEDEAMLADLAEKVKAGASFNSAAGGDHALANLLARYCRERGINSTAPTRWTVSERRPEIIRSGREAGKTWAEIAADIAAVEGTRGSSPAAITMWVARHCPDVFEIRPPKKIKYVDIDVRDTVRETALANRGKASASQIASAICVSRSSITGHWFRARSAGETA